MNDARANDLIGTWKLERFRVWDKHGNVSEPRGSSPYGYALFDASGIAFIQLANPDEALSPAERAASYFAYTGPFRTEPAEVLLSVTVVASNQADYLGTTQVRRYARDGQRLRLGTPGQYEALLVRVTAD